MLISTHWLQRHVDLEGIDLIALGDRFTMAVAELEGIEKVGFGLDRVVVGHVLEVSPIEGKRVQLTRVDCGEHGVLQIVCGAPNVAQGQYVCVALIGQQLGDLLIQAATVAGVPSSGMICSEAELGIGNDSDGILVLEGTPPLGRPLAEAIPGLEDILYDIDNKSLTHRPDLWGHRGIAREVAALIGRPLKALPPPPTFTDAQPLTLKVDDPDACPLYSAIKLSDITVAPSPLWLRLQLERVGTRAINNVVDATNFAMLDIGNPLHAFDARQISGATIQVRRATDGERFTTLDDVTHRLKATDLVIADADRAVALAGVMGGLNSEVLDDTTEIILEAANFDATAVRLTATHLGLRTESSSRFEKALDPALTGDAADTFIHLLQSLSPGTQVVSQRMESRAPASPLPEISLDPSYVEARLGHPVGREFIVKTLQDLGFQLEDQPSGKIKVTVPSWRATKDVSIQEDLIEEVGRIFGYDHIPPQAPTVLVQRPDANAEKKFLAGLRQFLALNLGLDEVETYSFDDELFLNRLGHTPGERVALENAISTEQPFMRREIAPHLLKILVANERQRDTVGVFELGRVFFPVPGDLPRQPKTLGILVASKTEAFDFFDGKSALESLSAAAERPCPRLVQGGVDLPHAHPVRQAQLLIGDTPVGVLAEISPRAMHRLDIQHAGFFLELDLGALFAAPPSPVHYRPLQRYPAVFRDVAVVIDNAVPAEKVREAIAAATPELIESIAFQSIWRGSAIGDSRKSLAWGITFRSPERTLEDAEIRAAEAKIWQQIEAIGGEQRL